MRSQEISGGTHGAALAAWKVVHLFHVRGHRRQGRRHRQALRALDLGHGRSGLIAAPPARSRNKLSATCFWTIYHQTSLVGNKHSGRCFKQCFCLH